MEQIISIIMSVFAGILIFIIIIRRELPGEKSQSAVMICY